jgi:GT2 family glycosyltransferase
MPSVTIIIVTWNSGKHLPHCLQCLAAQTYSGFQVMVVDNGSTDGATDRLEQDWPALHLHVHHLDKNYGFAAANNIGARLADSQWVALLNTDAFPEPNWLERLVETAKNRPEFSFFASRQIQANTPDFSDGAGDAYHVSGLAWRNYLGFPVGLFDLESKEVFGACAAAALYTREAFLDVGGFDEDFFSYFEDVDLSFRLRLRGYRCLYVAGAVVHHIGSATLGLVSDFALYYSHRNLIWTFAQNMPFPLLWIYLPAHLIANLIYLAYYTLRGRGKILWQAKRDAFLGLARVLRKRQEIQARRKVNSGDLKRAMEHGWLQPYLLGYHARQAGRILAARSKNK